MHKIRTTMQPDKEIEVGDAELLDLQRQGLVATDDVADEPAAPAAAPKKTPAPLVPGTTKEG